MNEAHEGDVMDRGAALVIRDMLLELQEGICEAINQLEYLDQRIDEVVYTGADRDASVSKMDYVVANLVIRAMKDQLSGHSGSSDDPLWWEYVDLSIETLAGLVRDMGIVPPDELKAKRVGHVIRKVVGLETQRLGRWGGRYCVAYDTDVIEAWMAKYE